MKFSSFLDNCRVSTPGVLLCEKNEVDGHTCAVLEEEDLVDLGMSKPDLEIILQIKTWLSDVGFLGWGAESSIAASHTFFFAAVATPPARARRFACCITKDD
jgi:hypothetical protein